MDIKNIDVTSLEPNPWNPNEMSSNVFQALEESFDEFGAELTPLVVRQIGDRFQIIDGEHRYKLAQKKGISELPCVVVNYSNTDCKRLTQILNRTRGEDDPVKLKKLFESLMDEIPKEDIIKGLPYATPEDLDSILLGLDEIINDLDTSDNNETYSDIDDVPETNKEETITNKGDIWLLGKHRLLCGDSSDIDILNHFYKNNLEKIKIVLTDPPYGINLNTDYSSISGGWSGVIPFAKSKSYAPVINDDKDYNPATLISFFIKTPEIFLWGGNYFADKLSPLTKCGWYVWDKTGGKQQETVGAEFELCWSKQKHKQEVINFKWAGVIGLSSQDTKSRIHPTQKPVEVNTFFINKFSKVGDIVADPFLGSGSTLIACEKTNRICYGMEISEKYCDVIVKRWEDYTGQKAVKEKDI